MLFISTYVKSIVFNSTQRQGIFIRFSSNRRTSTFADEYLRVSRAGERKLNRNMYGKSAKHLCQLQIDELYDHLFGHQVKEDKRDRPFFNFQEIHKSSKPGSYARVGILSTPNGCMQTPGFVSVASCGALKSINMTDAAAAGCELMFVNTYHLMVQGAIQAISASGGIHRFTSRHKTTSNGPFISDSGGFQVFSMMSGAFAEELQDIELKAAGGKKNRTNSVLSLSEYGIEFASYKDGTPILLTPENSIQNQKAIGADIIIPLDELLPATAGTEQVSESVLRNNRWQLRSLATHLDDIREQAIYCVIHGGINAENRERSASFLTSLPFDGIAIGGSLGKTKREMRTMLAQLMPSIKRKRHSMPVHLLGIGDIDNIINSVAFGIDSFDSCYLTRAARHGRVIVLSDPDGATSVYDKDISYLNLKNRVHRDDYAPLSPTCTCPTCVYAPSRAYLHHLLRANEPIVAQLLSVHNLWTVNQLMEQLRQDIFNNIV